jgi:hypothetical protein
MKKAKMIVDIICDRCGKNVFEEVDLMSCDLLDGDVVVDEIMHTIGFQELNGFILCDECLEEHSCIEDDYDFIFGEI